MYRAGLDKKLPVEQKVGHPDSDVKISSPPEKPIFYFPVSDTVNSNQGGYKKVH
jgi:hypothetical protein